MKLCYIIAPYRAPTLHGIHYHIIDAELAAVKLWKAGFGVICPHKNSAYFDGVVPDENFFAAGIKMLRLCDFAVAVGDYDHSDGCIKEMKQCEEDKIPYYLSVSEAIEREGV